MKRFKQTITANQIAQIFKAKTIGNGDIPLDSVTEPSLADASSIIFLEQEKLLAVVQHAEAGLIITTEQFVPKLESKNLMVVEKPYYSVLMLVSYWLKLQERDRASGIHESAVLGSNCVIGKNVTIGANSVIKDNCIIGDGTVIEENCYIGNDCKIGSDCRLYPRVNLYEETVLEDRVFLHSGVVIGADGFGYILLDGIQQKIPQIGNVVIHSDVEIGANSSIDRATFGSTVIGEGTKIDNLVQVGHNCVIGKHSILCA